MAGVLCTLDQVNVVIVLALALVQLFMLLLLVRIVIEMAESFSRQFRPPRWFAMIAEPIFKITDPPMRFVRRIIPPIRLGGVGLDLSVMVIFFVCSLVLMLLPAAIH